MNESEFLELQAQAARDGMRTAARGLLEDAARPLQLERVVRRRPLASVAVAALAGFACVVLLPARRAAGGRGRLARLTSGLAGHGMRVLRRLGEAALVASWPRPEAPPPARDEAEAFRDGIRFE